MLEESFRSFQCHRRISLVDGSRSDVAVDDSKLNQTYWGLDLRLDDGGTQSSVEWRSFSHCIPGLAMSRDLASRSGIDYYRE